MWDKYYPWNFLSPRLICIMYPNLYHFCISLATAQNIWILESSQDQEMKVNPDFYQLCNSIIRWFLHQSLVLCFQIWHHTILYHTFQILVIARPTRFHYHLQNVMLIKRQVSWKFSSHRVEQLGNFNHLYSRLKTSSQIQYHVQRVLAQCLVSWFLFLKSLCLLYSLAQ